MRMLLFTFLAVGASYYAVLGRSSDVEIGLLTHAKPTKIIITPLRGDYSLISNDSLIYSLKNQDLLHISLKDGQLELTTLNGRLGDFPNVRLIPQGKDGAFKLKPVIPYGRAKYYDDILIISNAGEWLKVVNEVNIDKYVAGVVKSEVGTNEGLELYKVQAIICRTYALSNFRKHEEEDFQLCDKVHCQVFGGSCDQAKVVAGVAYTGNNDILRAAIETSGLVLVDTTLELITASFHSNCGGQTCNSEDVWTLPKLYLKSVQDPYCIQRRNARWEREVSQTKWLDYYERVHAYKVDDELSRERVLNFTQTSRTPYFQNNRDILLKEVRSDWRFRSTFFSTHVSGDQVVVQGRGFGHGVGLCQEGAMEMALRGISHKEILNFYYTEVALIDIASLRFLLR